MKNAFVAQLAALPIVLAACASHEAVVVDPVLSPTLEVRADQQAHAAIPDGARLPDVLVGVATRAGEGTSWGVALHQGQCYALGFATDLDLERLNLALWSPANKRVANQRFKSTQGVLNYCAATNGVYRLEAKVIAGGGHFVVVSYASGVAAPAPVVVGPAPTNVTVIVH